MDEHRVGLQPILRRVWAPRGQRPTAPVHPRYEWLYVYGFVQPATGAAEFLLLPTVNVDAFGVALAEFAKEMGAGPRKQIVLVLDGAGWHASPKLAVPPHLQLVPLPPYSPELQPAERLWPLTDEVLANRTFASLAELDQVLGDHCVRLTKQPARIQALTRFHWGPQWAA
jgi:transposase